MKETKKTEKVENVAHKNAVAIAKTIEEIMGKDFFTIDQMRKKMIIKNNKGSGKSLSWSEARGYINSIIPYGLAEPLAAKNDIFKIRLDNEYRLNYLKNQVELRINEKLELENLISEIDPVISIDEKKGVPLKKTAKVYKKK